MNCGCNHVIKNIEMDSFIITPIVSNLDSWGIYKNEIMGIDVEYDNLVLGKQKVKLPFDCPKTESYTLDVLKQGTCGEGEAPSMTRTDTYLSVTAGFEVVEVSKLEMDILNTFFGQRMKDINTVFNNRRRNARDAEQEAALAHDQFLKLEYTKNSWDDIMVDSDAVTHCVSEPESCFPGMSEDV